MKRILLTLTLAAALVESATAESWLDQVTSAEHLGWVIWGKQHCSWTVELADYGNQKVNAKFDDTKVAELSARVLKSGKWQWVKQGSSAAEQAARELGQAAACSTVVKSFGPKGTIIEGIWYVDPKDIKEWKTTK